MAKRGGNLSMWRFNKKRDLKRIKKLFFTFLDSLVLLSFALSVYFTYLQDYTRTILFLSVGFLLLLFFIVRGIVKSTKSIFFK
jgi:hypothetical protein